MANEVPATDGDDSWRLLVREDADVAIARSYVRDLARRADLAAAATEALATAVSEIARNIVVHANSGEIVFKLASERGRRGIVVVASDRGPGISDAEAAMTDGYSTGRGLGLGLSSARRLVDEFELISTPGSGTTIVLKKWAALP